MIIAQRWANTAGGPRPRGTWATMRLPDGRTTASYVCPGCGLLATLEDHQIDAAGNATPSLVCPAACGFHDTVRLDGWSHGP